MRIAEVAPTSAAVALFPSDHYVSDTHAFVRHVAAGFSVVEKRPELTVLLGIAPDSPERSYGWIEPGERIWGEFPVYRVRRFFEKPEAELASNLWRSGALWNSFVIVARVSTLIATFMMALPQLYLLFSSVRRSLGTALEQPTIERLYSGLASFNYSEEVLQKCSSNLAVLPVEGVSWSDLGDPDRVIEAWARAGIRPWQAA
jgi:mannose-1-phosphate guanylyltransferase